MEKNGGALPHVRGDCRQLRAGQRGALPLSEPLPTKGLRASGHLELVSGTGGVIEPGRSHRAQCPGRYLVSGPTSVPPKRKSATPNARYRFPKALGLWWVRSGEGKALSGSNLRADGALPLQTTPPTCSALWNAGSWCRALEARSPASRAAPSIGFQRPTGLWWGEFERGKAPLAPTGQ